MDSSIRRYSVNSLLKIIPCQKFMARQTICCPSHTGRIWHSSVKAILGERMTISLRYDQVSPHKKKEKPKYLHARWKLSWSLQLHLGRWPSTHRPCPWQIIGAWKQISSFLQSSRSTIHRKALIFFGSFVHGRTKEELAISGHADLLYPHWLLG